MTESFRQVLGRKVVSRATAHQLGTVGQLLTTVDCRRMAVVIIGRGKKAQLVDWAQLSGLGSDAVMVSDESALRSPIDDREQKAADGKLALIGRRTLSELGNELGTVEDIMFDPATGVVETLTVAARPIPAEAVLGAGSYAVVVAASQDPA
ncbi:MAG: PRC-barrel domain-containing protein [Actinomycetota bacterium]|nr:PRC-barrel domain-containing protein [Actinomycetota bacterium]